MARTKTRARLSLVAALIMIAGCDDSSPGPAVPSPGPGDAAGPPSTDPDTKGFAKQKMRTSAPASDPKASAP